MGMSASQARLLTLTARLNHNELRAQKVANAKIRLSDSTEQASDEYIRALNKTVMNYTTFDELGNAVNQKMTGAALYTYSPIKNQYGLVNAAGQLLVTELDGHNFEESNTLEEFLDKYGLLGSLDDAKVIQVNNPAYTEAKNAYYEEYKNWQEREPKLEDYTKTEEVAKTDNEIYQAVTSSGGCLSGAIGGSCCYMHVLSDLIGPGEVTTSDGNTYTIYDGSCGEHSNSWCWNTARHGVDKFAPITEMLKNGKCSGDDIEGGIEQVNAPYGKVPVGGPASDPNMSLWQRCVDLLWDVHEEYSVGSATGGSATQESLAKFFYFVEHDLKQAVKEEVTTVDEEGFNDAHQKWALEEPVMEEVPEYIEKYIRQLLDADEGQWYINMWHRMNGESDYKAGYMSNPNYNEENDGWVTDSKTGQSYAILEDGLMNDPDWLEFALKNGVLTMEQAQYTEIGKEGSGLKNVAWTSFIYTSMTEMSEEVNERERTKAEVKYTRAQQEIEAKDKQFDNDLKLLDTEHNALQTEYDSIKNVISKNIERTFKTFS